MEGIEKVDLDMALRTLLMNLPPSAVVDILLQILSDRRLFHNPEQIKLAIYHRFKSLGAIP